jgi:Flp pilus assembly protein TadD
VIVIEDRAWRRSVPRGFPYNRKMPRQADGGRGSQGSVAAALADAQALIRAGRPADAVDALERLTVESPRDPAAWVALGVARAMLARHAEAIDASSRAVALAPRAPGVQLAHGDVLRVSGRIGAARRAYAAAVELAPNDADALNKLAGIERIERDFDAAQAHLDRALALAPAHPYVQVNLATLAVERAQVGVARRRLSDALRLPRLPAKPRTKRRRRSRCSTSTTRSRPRSSAPASRAARPRSRRRCACAASRRAATNTGSRARAGHRAHIARGADRRRLRPGTSRERAVARHRGASQLPPARQGGRDPAHDRAGRLRSRRSRGARGPRLCRRRRAARGHARVRRRHRLRSVAAPCARLHGGIAPRVLSRPGEAGQQPAALGSTSVAAGAARRRRHAAHGDVAHRRRAAARRVARVPALLRDHRDPPVPRRQRADRAPPPQPLARKRGLFPCLRPGNDDEELARRYSLARRERDMRDVAAWFADASRYAADLDARWSAR